uniref:Uncharacterized protein n=1 Tax=Globisporangium ultimum (strain ATCC 200006 / CBS 805.95 / DAOM BR144) TaxID=431595 RepID=K3WE35_GLOUD
MDNAKYHKVLPATAPKRGSKKEVLLNACQQYGIAVPSNAAKPILWEVLSKHINKSVVPVVVDVARAEGHDVVYTPSHHSDLQPIEIVWAIATLGAIQGCIDAAKKQLLELKKHLEAMDAQNESSDDDAECNSDNGGSDGGSDWD